MEKDPIKHVIVLMLENRSFDQMLGAMQQVYPDTCDGVDPKNLRTNRVSTTEEYQQAETTTLCIDPDPIHELKNVLRQIEKESEFREPKKIGKCRRFLEWLWAALCVVFSYLKPPRHLLVKMQLAKPYEGAFVSDFATDYPKSTPQQRQEIMGYYPLHFLPAHHALASEFLICDRWYSSLPGPTWPNRFFVHSGNSLGRVWMPETKKDIIKMRPYDQTTIYDRLNEKNVSWKIYFGDIPQSLVLTHQLDRENIVNYWPMKRFYEDAAGPASSFPEYCFIEPTYFLSTANDDHPPHNTMHGQCLTADVYNALRKNEELWKSSLFVIVYDEHGGFYDHVEPPRTICPDGFTDEYTFDRLGVRVPAILVSPWVKKGVLSTQFDHASLLRYLSDKWDLGPLGKRVAQANGIGEAIQENVDGATNRLPKIEDTPAMTAARAEDAHEDEHLNRNQLALLAFSTILAGALDAARQLRPPHALLAREPTADILEVQRQIELLIQEEQTKSSYETTRSSSFTPK